MTSQNTAIKPVDDKTPLVEAPGLKLDLELIEPTLDNDPLEAIAANQRKDQEARDHQGRIEPTMPSADAFKNIANTECLDLIAALFNRTEPHFAYEHLLSGLVVINQDKEAGSLLLKGSDNTYTLTNCSVEAEEETISPTAALEMAALIANNPAFNPEKPLVLTGNTRDRYVLTLAAAALNLPVSNPVSDADLPDELKAECAALKAEIEPTLVAKGQDALKDILGEDATPDVAADFDGAATTDQKPHYKMTLNGPVPNKPHFKLAPRV